MEAEIDIFVHDDERAFLDKENKEEVFYSCDMTCPVFGCSKSAFTSKKSYLRHWDECHRRMKISYQCAVASCQVTCRKRTDMRTHIRNRHDRNTQRVEDILTKCQVLKQENRKFIDPGAFEFRGRAKIGMEKAGSAIDADRQGNLQEKRGGNLPSTTEQQPCSDMSREHQRTQDEGSEVGLHSCNDIVDDWDPPTSSKSVEVQTLCCGMPPMEVPPVPDEERELEMYLVVLCNGIDAACRSRALAKQRLDEIRRDKKRGVSQWEEEIRRLKEELKKLREGQIN
jgi:hypothetical protein